MVNKLFATLFDHIKNVDSVSNVSITPKSLIVNVGIDDDSCNRIVRLGNILGLTVVCSRTYSNEYVIVSFNL